MVCSATAVHPGARFQGHVCLQLCRVVNLLLLANCTTSCVVIQPYCLLGFVGAEALSSSMVLYWNAMAVTAVPLSGLCAGTCLTISLATCDEMVLQTYQ